MLPSPLWYSMLKSIQVHWHWSSLCVIKRSRCIRFIMYPVWHRMLPNDKCRHFCGRWLLANKDINWLSEEPCEYCLSTSLCNAIVSFHQWLCVKVFNIILPLNACQIYFVECVSTIKHILSVIHHTICGVVCFQFIHFSCAVWENIYTLSYYHHQIGSMNYFLHPVLSLFRVRSWNNGVRCMSLYILRA